MPPSTSSISPVTEETTPWSPPPAAKSLAAAVEPHPELYRAQSSDHPDSELEALPAAPEAAEEEEEEEKKEIPRHIGVPVMGMDLLAEMKARQERMAVKKVGGASGLRYSEG